MKGIRINSLGSKTRIITLIVLFGMIIVGWAMLMNRRDTFRPGERQFRLEPEQHPAVISISKSAAQEHILLERTLDGSWLLDKRWKANEAAVKEVIRTLRNVSVRQMVSLSEQEDVNALMDTGGVRVEVFESGYRIRLPFNMNLIPAEKKILDIYVGSDTPDGSSTYMRVAGADRAFIVQIPASPRGISRVFHSGKQVWRDPGLLPWPHREVREIAVSWPEKKEDSFILIPKEDGQHELYSHNGTQIGRERINDAGLNLFLQAFSGLHYEKLLEEKDFMAMIEPAYDKPFITITISGPGQEKVQLDCFYSIHQVEDDYQLPTNSACDPDRFLLRMNEEQWAVAQFYLFSRVMRPLGFFLTE